MSWQGLEGPEQRGVTGWDLDFGKTPLAAAEAMGQLGDTGRSASIRVKGGGQQQPGAS